jgi:hypothetical protein
MTHRDESLRLAVAARLHALRLLAPPLLRALPAFSEEPTSIAGRTEYVAIWRQAFSDGRTLIVVQAKQNVALGFGFMAAEGFVLTGDGITEDATDALLSEYR